MFALVVALKVAGCQVDFQARAVESFCLGFFKILFCFFKTAGSCLPQKGSALNLQPTWIGVGCFQVLNGRAAGIVQGRGKLIQAATALTAQDRGKSFVRSIVGGGKAHFSGAPLRKRRRHLFLRAVDVELSQPRWTLNNGQQQCRSQNRYKLGPPGAFARKCLPQQPALPFRFGTL